MSWENNNFGLTPEQEEMMRQRQRRQRFKSLGVPKKYWDSNIEGLKAVIESSKEGPLTKLPTNIEGEVVKSMGFKGRNFKNAWTTLKKNTSKQLEKERLEAEAQELRRQEIFAIIEAERAAFREELAREQAAQNSQQAIRNREQAMRNTLRNIHRKLQPSYIEASKKVNREFQRRKSRKARGKNNNRFSMFSKENTLSNGVKVNKRNKTKERNTLRKKK